MDPPLEANHGRAEERKPVYLGRPPVNGDEQACQLVQARATQGETRRRRPHPRACNAGPVANSSNRALGHLAQLAGWQWWQGTQQTPCNIGLRSPIPVAPPDDDGHTAQHSDALPRTRLMPPKHQEHCTTCCSN